MKFAYKFNNILGSAYDRGNLIFFPENDQLLSPYGNKVINFDLKNGRSEALPIELQYNIARMALSPSGTLLLVATEQVQLMMISMINGVVLHRKDFKNLGDKIVDLCFSPDGRYYAVCGSSQVNCYLTPGFALKDGAGGGRHLSAFKIHRIIRPSHDECSALAWNATSQVLMITSQDFSMRIYPIDRTIAKQFRPITLTGHNDLIMGAFFSNQSTDSPLDVYSISRNGQFFIWKASRNQLVITKNNDDDDDNEEEDDDANTKPLNYTIKKKKYIMDDLKEKNSHTRVSSYSYQAKAKLMVVGFNNGSFMLYEVPDVILIHSLQLSNKGPITSVTFNSSGYWIAIGSTVGLGTRYDVDNEVSTQTQLIVWEWQSESFILKQSGYACMVTNSYECLAYSPDASLMVTGGTDGRIKVWNTFSGFCLSTFSTEHRGPVTGVEFVPGKGGKVFCSCSLDGTVKVFDLNRYRCFRTLAAPSESKPAQFICLAVDKIGGDFIAAGSHNFFEIFLWSLKTGRLLDVLTGHEGPVSAVKFSPISNTLYSCSWDSTLRIWSLFEGANCTREAIKLGSDALSLAVRDDGAEVAVSTLNGTINFFNAHSGDQLGIGIEGKDDLGTARYRGEVTNDKYRYFSTVCYSADGEYVLTAGKSKWICLYNVKEKLLVKKFEISNNLSLDGFAEFVSKRKIQEFGFNLSVIKHREDNGGLAPISLPGVVKSDYADRQMNPIIAVHEIRFSPTMRTFAFASTEGLLVYSLDNANIFDPFELDTSVTPIALRKNLSNGEYSQALVQSLRLNDQTLIQEVIERTPMEQVSTIVSSLPTNYVQKLLIHLATVLERTKHLEFYLHWVTQVLSLHCTVLKTKLSADSIASALRHLHQSLTRQHKDLAKICDHNKYLLRFLPILAKNVENENDDDEMDAEVNYDDDDDDDEEEEEMNE